MRTILIPVDASGTTENTINYAVEWSKTYCYDQITLIGTTYNTLFDYVSMGATYALANPEHLTQQQNRAKTLLIRLANLIKEKIPDKKVALILSDLPLLRSIIEQMKQDATIELIAVGSTQKTVENDGFVCANIVSIARISPVKVLVVPDSRTYHPLKNLLVPCDISNPKTKDRLKRLKRRFEGEDIHALLLNVNNSLIEESHKERHQDILNRFISGIQYSIHYIQNPQVIEGILSFLNSHEIDLIIALPGKHSFLYYLTNKSISEALYKNNTHPALILK